IGLLGAGTFVQAAGTNTATTVFSVGENVGSIGTYTIGGTAALSSPELDVGFEGQGVFFQNGGTVTSPNINLAARNGSTGTYVMTGGSVVATGPVNQPGDIIVAIDNGTNASFTQIAGSVTSSGDMSLGYNAGSRGSYTFDGGTINANRVQVAGNPLTAGGFGTFTQNGGVLNASGTVKVWGINRGVYRFNGGQFTANALDITGGRYIVGAASGGVPRVNSLSIGGNGRFDLNDNKLIIDYTGASPIGAVATPNTITNYIATGRNGGVGGTWTGPGLTSSTANGNLFAVGVAEASQAFGISGAGTATFGGQTVDATSVLVKFTYYGDTDLNGIVDFDDYSHTDQGFNNNWQGWFNGDFDYNGIVDFDDYSLIDFAYNTQTVTLGRAVAYLDGSDRSGQGMNADALKRVQEHYQQFGESYANAFLAAVPEPTSLSVLGLAMVGMSRRRRR
ncbi:MAG: PEP-CTERM sorting domain-containing protein, partial [Anaerolineae bacterium]|nr:PEP-CTERM sorting domain-containing protein [Phycisphaerae bacterium]